MKPSDSQRNPILDIQSISGLNRKICELRVDLQRKRVAIRQARNDPGRIVSLRNINEEREKLNSILLEFTRIAERLGTVASEDNSRDGSRDELNGVRNALVQLNNDFESTSAMLEEKVDRLLQEIGSQRHENRLVRDQILQAVKTLESHDKESSTSFLAEKKSSETPQAKSSETPQAMRIATDCGEASTKKDREVGTEAETTRKNLTDHPEYAASQLNSGLDEIAQVLGIGQAKQRNEVERESRTANPIYRSLNHDQSDVARIGSFLEAIGDETDNLRRTLEKKTRLLEDITKTTPRSRSHKVTAIPDVIKQGKQKEIGFLEKQILRIRNELSSNSRRLLAIGKRLDELQKLQKGTSDRQVIGAIRENRRSRKRKRRSNVESLHGKLESKPRPRRVRRIALNRAGFSSSTSKRAEIRMHVRRKRGVKMQMFSIGRDTCAMEAGRIRSIIERADTVLQRRQSEHAEGIMDFGGRVIPVLNLRKLFGVAGRAPSDSKLIVTKTRGRSVAFIVDGMGATVSIPAERIFPLAPLAKSIGQHYVRGICRLKGKPTIYLDIPKITDEAAQLGGVRSKRVRRMLKRR